MEKKEVIIKVIIKAESPVDYYRKVHEILAGIPYETEVIEDEG